MAKITTPYAASTMMLGEVSYWGENLSSGSPCKDKANEKSPHSKLVLETYAWEESLPNEISANLSVSFSPSSVGKEISCLSPEKESFCNSSQTEYYSQNELKSAFSHPPLRCSRQSENDALLSSNCVSSAVESFVEDTSHVSTEIKSNFSVSTPEVSSPVEDVPVSTFTKDEKVPDNMSLNSFPAETQKEEVKNNDIESAVKCDKRFFDLEESMDSFSKDEAVSIFISDSSINQLVDPPKHTSPTTRSRKMLRSKTRISDFAYAKKLQLSRSFSINTLDMNKNPSWPPMKRNKVCNSDWNVLNFSRTEPSPESKSNRLFLNSLASLYDGVVTNKSTLGRKAGLGLFCTRKEGFKKAIVFTEFVGWMVHRDDAEKFRRERRASHIVAVEKGFLYIDGEKFPHFGIGGGSFANDGSEFLGGPGNNAEFYYWYDEQLGRKRVFLRATRDIHENEEIFVPYNKQYWVDNFEEELENCPPTFREKQLQLLQKREKERETRRKNQAQKRDSQPSKGDSGCKTKPLVKQKVSNTRKVKALSLREKQGNFRKKHPLPLSAYLRFSMKKRQELCRESSEWKHRFVELSKLIGRMWHELDAKERLLYEKEASMERQQYRKQIEKLQANQCSSCRLKTASRSRKGISNKMKIQNTASQLASSLEEPKKHEYSKNGARWSRERSVSPCHSEITSFPALSRNTKDLVSASQDAKPDASNTGGLLTDLEPTCTPHKNKRSHRHEKESLNYIVNPDFLFNWAPSDDCKSISGD
ncbi:SET domain containing lysine methyltransferase KMTox [Cardiosporidium cionae]|uniref:SET domain containing lysine methyltransferase KMTox n=1 Tax=Cardiosporidium cionae TaxID=476202 RepID=A0ABQ7JB17_9APIC|nr:SET domain containing lysine methyltransferase KMTox [Cardiosporidium cionae]|eukprot:KAF8821186.1 SET domain containing lysine methyltransferase KMTox [Cardiosporidium cionae]